MKRVLSLVLVLVLVLGTFPVFADTSTYGEQLFEMGLLQGDGNGDLNEDAALTRAEMMVILARLYGVEAEAMAFPLPSTFTDVPADAWYAPYVAYAQLEGWTNGYGDGTFGPNDPVDEQMVAAFMLRALGYEGTWETALEDAAALGIDTEASTPMRRGEVFEMMFDTINTENSEGVVLGEALGVMEPVVVVPDTLEVVSVEAINLVQIEVVFNMEVDVDTAEDKNNYTVTDEEDYDINVLSATLGEDAKTVVLLLDDTDSDERQQLEATVEIVDIEDLEENVLVDTDMEVEFLDMTIPTITGAEVVGNDTIKVFFSEPLVNDDITDKGNYEVNGGSLYIKEATAGSSDMSAYVELYSDLEDGDYTIEVSGLEDYAGFDALTTEFTVTVTEDTEAPFVVGYKDADPTGVTLIWNEDIEFTGIEEDVYHTNSGNYAVDVSVEDNEMAIEFAEAYALPEGTAYVYVLEDVVNDLWDNDASQQMVQIEVELDTTAPAVDGDFDVETETEGYVTFTEDVDLDDLEVTLLDADGDDVSDIVNVPNSVDVDFVATFTFDEDLSGEYTMILEGVVDGAYPTANEMPATTLVFTVDDLTAPEFEHFSATLYNAGDEDQMLRIDFEEKMATDGTYAVTNIENYVVNGETLADLDCDVTFAMVNDGESVEVYIPSKDDDSDDGVDLVATGTVMIARVADAAGNYTADFSGYVDYDAAGYVEFDTVYATDVDTIEVTLDGELDAFEADDFSIELSTTTDATIIGVDTDLDEDGNTVIIFTIEEELDYDGTYDGTTVTVITIDTPESVNAYGEYLVGSADESVVDAIAPAFYMVPGTGDDDDYENIYVTVTTGDQIILVFTETIDLGTLSTMTFEVGNGDYEVEVMNYGGDAIMLEVDNADGDDLVGVTVTQVAAIKDMAGNVVTGLSGDIYLVTP